jgi:hypothetical protein
VDCEAGVSDDGLAARTAASLTDSQAAKDQVERLPAESLEVDDSVCQETPDDLRQRRGAKLSSARVSAAESLRTQNAMRLTCSS